MKIAIVDTETTGLTLAELAGIDKQPRIIELGVVITDGKQVLDKHNWLINPGNLPLDPVITKITGIKTEQLEHEHSFCELLDEIKAVFEDVDIFIAHNAPFDTSLIRFDLERCECLDFPWPPEIICTAQEYTPLFGKRPTMKALYEHIIGKPLAQTHRAMDDAMALYEILIADSFFEKLK
jgi:DNA polymerase III epsilon subunit-like protein